MFGSKNDCYVEQVLDDGLSELVRVQTERCGACDEMKQGRVIVSSIERKTCVEESCCVCGVQIQMWARKNSCVFTSN